VQALLLCSLVVVRLTLAGRRTLRPAKRARARVGIAGTCASSAGRRASARRSSSARRNPAPGSRGILGRRGPVVKGRVEGCGAAAPEGTRRRERGSGSSPRRRIREMRRPHKRP